MLKGQFVNLIVANLKGGEDINAIKRIILQIEKNKKRKS